MLLHRRRVAMEMKELRTKVEDVSGSNARYSLINGSAGSSKSSATASGHYGIAGGGATMSGIDEVRRQRDQAKVDLVRLIINKDDDLRVIAMWQTSSSDLGETSIIKRAYEDPKIHKKFECRAWIMLMHPFNPTKFLQSIVRQFYVNYLQDQAGEREKATSDAQVLRRMGMMKEDDLANEFKRYVNEKSYLIVLDDLHTIEEWDRIKTCFPHNKKGSRIIVSAEQVEVASLCVGPENEAPEHKQLCADKTLYAFYQKGSQDGTNSTAIGTNNSTHRNNIIRMETMVLANLEESQLIGRGDEKTEIIKLVSTNRYLGVLEVAYLVRESISQRDLAYGGACDVEVVK